jgi:5-methylcytosine-specific restriction enzyme subunit McrC
VEVLDDDELMQKVFEDFVRNFYRLEQTTFRVLPRSMEWQAGAKNLEDLEFLPKMVMDTVLRSRSRTIVIETKYYKDTFQSFYSKERIRAENLYQLTSYLSNLEVRDAGNPKPEGVLLYPVSDSKVDLSYTILGRSVRICTLNLALILTMQLGPL